MIEFIECQRTSHGQDRGAVLGRLCRRPRKAIRNGYAHVGTAKLRDQRAIAKLDQAVHDRLWMHQDIDLVRTKLEQMMRFNELEALVHHRRQSTVTLRPIDQLGCLRSLLHGCDSDLYCGRFETAHPRPSRSRGGHPHAGFPLIA